MLYLRRHWSICNATLLVRANVMRGVGVQPPPSPATTDFTPITVCTPEISGYNSVYSVCQPQRMCSMALKNPLIFKWKNLRNVNSTLGFDFNILVCQYAITWIPERHIKIFKEKVFLLYGAFRYYCDKNMSQSAMTLIAERHTPWFFKLNH